MHIPELLPATHAFLARPAKMLIGGQWRAAANGETLPSIDPSTGKVIAAFPAGTAGDADEAVRAARRAFPAWKKITPYDRTLDGAGYIAKCAGGFNGFNRETCELTFSPAALIYLKRLAERGV